MQHLNFDESDPEQEKFGKRIEEIRTPHIDQLIPDFERLFQRKTFQEPLSECQDQRWLDRFIGAHETLWNLRNCRPIVENACRPFQIWFFDRLLSEIDGYMREMCEFLLGERKFTLSADATLNFDLRSSSLVPFASQSGSLANGPSRALPGRLV